MILFFQEPRSSLISSLPFPLYNQIRRKMYNKHEVAAADYCDLKRVYFQKSLTDIKHFKKVMVFRRGDYDYEYFNVCFLNNVLGLCLYALSTGFLPRIEIMTSEGKNLWEEFFVQPFSEISTEGMKKIVVNERVAVNVPKWKVVYDEKLISFYNSLHRMTAILNDTAEEYISSEIRQVKGMGKILGVLCRGTDYTESRPKEHPVQPSAEVILAKATQTFEENGYDYLYLATEDSRYDKLFRDRFGDRLLTNRRNYYDKVFADQQISLIKDVHFERENDDYLKGLEYLSSLKILAECDGLVAGNCGGTQCAVIWNNNSYEDKYVFDLGYY